MATPFFHSLVVGAGHLLVLSRSSLLLVLSSFSQKPRCPLHRCPHTNPHPSLNLNFPWPGASKRARSSTAKLAPTAADAPADFDDAAVPASPAAAAPADKDVVEVVALVVVCKWLVTDLLLLPAVGRAPGWPGR